MDPENGARGLDFADLDPRAWDYLNRFFSHSQATAGVPLRERLAFFDQLTTRLIRFIVAGDRLDRERGSPLGLLLPQQWVFVDFLQADVPGYKKKPLPELLADLVFLTLSPQEQSQVLANRREGRDDIVSLESVLNERPGTSALDAVKTGAWSKIPAYQEAEDFSGKRGLQPGDIGQDFMKMMEDFFKQNPGQGSAEPGGRVLCRFPGPVKHPLDARCPGWCQPAGG